MEAETGTEFLDLLVYFANDHNSLAEVGIQEFPLFSHMHRRGQVSSHFPLLRWIRNDAAMIGTGTHAVASPWGSGPGMSPIREQSVKLCTLTNKTPWLNLTCASHSQWLLNITSSLPNKGILSGILFHLPINIQEDVTMSRNRMRRRIISLPLCL